MSEDCGIPGCSGPVNAVLAVWDLSELERCVLAGRFGA